MKVVNSPRWPGAKTPAATVMVRVMWVMADWRCNETPDQWTFLRRNHDPAGVSLRVHPPRRPARSANFAALVLEQRPAGALELLRPGGVAELPHLVPGFA